MLWSLRNLLHNKSPEFVKFHLSNFPLKNQGRPESPSARTGPGSGLIFVAHFLSGLFKPGPTKPEWADPRPVSGRPFWQLYVMVTDKYHSSLVLWIFLTFKDLDKFSKTA
jgi:hypothetical protein